MKMLTKNAGLTLIELMISLALGLILAAAAVSIFVGNKEAYKLQEALANTQENGRFAMNTLLTSIRSASGKTAFLDGIGIDQLQNMTECSVNGAIGSATESSALIGYNADDAPGSAEFLLASAGAGDADKWTQGDAGQSTDLPDAISELSPMRGRDIILYSTPASSAGCGGAIGVFNPTNVHVEFSDAEGWPGNPNPCGLDICSIVIVVKDGYASLFAVTEISDAVNSPPYIWEVKGQTKTSECGCNNATHKFDSDPDGGEMFVPKKNVYTALYIAKNSSGRYSLWKAEGPDFDAPVELVEGVYDMQFEYYQADDDETQVRENDADFDRADEVTSWNNVIAARISLLMESDQAVLSQEQTIDFSGFNYPGNTSPDADDFRLKKAFNVTVAVRNKVL